MMTKEEEEAEDVRLWLFIEDRLAEDEAARIEALSDQELEAEMRAAGADPASILTLDQALARGRATLDGGARGAVSGAEVGAGNGNGNEGPGGAAAYDGAGIARAVPASAVSESTLETRETRRLPSARSPRWAKETGPAPEARGTRGMVWLLAACFLLAVGAVGYAKRGAIVARFHEAPVDIGPAPVPMPAPPQPEPPLPADDARTREWTQDRERAQQACDAHDWAKCQQWLGQANVVDPDATIRDERIQAMWKSIPKNQVQQPKTGLPRP
ncbi:MAG: hypothetical protein ACRENE_33265 [Polyangiaceae bacterium]